MIKEKIWREIWIFGDFWAFLREKIEILRFWKKNLFIALTILYFESQWETFSQSLGWSLSFPLLITSQKLEFKDFDLKGHSQNRENRLQNAQPLQKSQFHISLIKFPSKKFNYLSQVTWYFKKKSLFSRFLHLNLSIFIQLNFYSLAHNEAS